MAQAKKDILLIAKEATRGTAETTFPLDQSYVGHLQPAITQGLGEVMASATWPYLAAAVAVGATCQLTFQPDLNINTIRDIIAMIVARTSGAQHAFTIAHNQQGVAAARYAGCVARQLTLEFSRGSSPDGSSILAGTMELDCMQSELAGSVAAGTPATGNRFQLRHSTITINGVAYSAVTSFRCVISVEHSSGPPGASNARAWMTDGLEQTEIVATVRMATNALRTLVEAGTEMASTSFVLATGTANETITGTVAKAKISSRTLQEMDGEVLEEVTIRPYYGSTYPVVWTAGSAIGASALSIAFPT